MEINTERVAMLLLEKNVSVASFKKKVYNDTEFSDKALNKALNLTREKIFTQRRPEDYAIKFWSEVLEHYNSTSNGKNMAHYTEEQLDLLDDYIAAESDDHSNLFLEIWSRIPERNRTQIIESIEQSYGTTIAELEEQRGELEDLDDNFAPFEDEDE